MGVIPLRTTRRVLGWLCIYPTNKMISNRTKVSYIIFSVILFILNLNGLVASASYLLKFASTDLESALYALFQVDALTATGYTNIVLLLSRHRFVVIFDNLNQIFDANDSSFRFLAHTNSQCEWLWKFFFKFVMGGYCGSLAVASVGSILFCLVFIGQVESDHLFSPYRLILPWNRNNSVGYFGEIYFGTISGQPYFLLNGVILLLFISMCLFHRAFLEMFQCLLRKLDDLDKSSSDEKLLCDLIRFHAQAKSWFLQSADIYSHFLVIQLLCNIIYMSCAVFELDLKVHDIDFDIFLLMIALSTSGLSLFLFCFFGKMATDSYEQMSISLFEYNWLNLSLDLQKYVLLMIRNSQIPLYYHAFGVITLDLETFSKLLKTVFTYYMMFKTITTQ